MVWLVAEDMSKLSLLLGGKGSSAWTLQQTFLWRTCFSKAMKKPRRVSGSWKLIIHHLESSITVNIKLAEQWVDILHLTWSPGSSRENTKHWNLCFGWISWWRFLRASCYFCRSIYLFIFSHVERDALRQTSALSGSINSLESRRAARCSLTCALWLDENLFVMFVRCDRRAQ